MKTYKQLGITKEQRANLKKLADYLSSGKLKAYFDMEVYADAAHKYNSHNCGSVGCAVGHGPYAGVKKPKNMNWKHYAIEKFGANFSFSADGTVNYEYYEFLFSCLWYHEQPRATQAAKRIYLLLEKGLPSNYLNVRRGVEKRFKYEQNK